MHSSKTVFMRTRHGDRQPGHIMPQLLLLQRKVMFRQPIWLTLIHSGPTHCSHYSSEKVTWTEGEVMETNQKYFHNGEKWRFKSVTAVRQYYPFSSMLTSTIPLTIWTYWNVLQYRLSRVAVLRNKTTGRKKCFDRVAKTQHTRSNHCCTTQNPPLRVCVFLISVSPVTTKSQTI